MMEPSTCWTLIHAAAQGDSTGQEELFRRYEKPIRAYLIARWKGTPFVELLEDTIQQVFLECYRKGGALERLDPHRLGGFRAYLYGIVRNVARHGERRAGKSFGQVTEQELLRQLPVDESSLSKVFDRAWAKALVLEARRALHRRAVGLDEAARRRVQLLRLRFHDNLPIREIARLWQTDPKQLHREYAKAREEFRQTLKDVVAEHCPGTPQEIDTQCRELLDLLR